MDQTIKRMKNLLKPILFKVIAIITLLASAFFADAQGTEYVGEVEITGEITANYIYTKSVTIKPEATISSANGDFLIKPYATNPPPASAASQNYVRTEVAKVPTSSEVTFTHLNADDKVTSYTYSDGVGRAKMSVTSQVGPDYEDVVQHNEYNPTTGRQDRTYLPYAKVDGSPGSIKTNPTADLNNFYNGSKGIPDDTKYYTETEWDARGRAEATTGVGEDWDGRESTINYRLNDPAVDGPIGRFYFDDSGEITSDLYEKNQVRVTVTTNEQGQQVRQVVDSRGLAITFQAYDQSLGKWIGSYNVYDDYGRVVCILPPLITKNIGLSATLKPTPQQIYNLAYEYVFDKRGRLIREKSPQTEWTEYIYDQWNRMVLKRVPGQFWLETTKEAWTFYKYDALNRVVMSGQLVWKAGKGPTRNMDQQTHTKRYEEKITYNSDGYSTYFTYPIFGSPPNGRIATDVANETIERIYYYDNYDFLNLSNWDAENKNFALVLPTGFNGQQSQDVKGMPTGNQTKVLGENNYLNSVIYYDDRLRAIQAITENHLGGLDRQTNQFDWQGELQRSMTQHTGLQTVTILNEYEYAHNGQLLKTWQTIDEPENPGARVLVAEYKYNALGQPVEKNLHSTGGRSFLQSVDYDYNIRGWVSAINDADLSDGEGDLFGMQYNYTEAVSLVAGPPNKLIEARYDGLVSSVVWKASNITPSDTPEDGPQEGVKSIYGYQYDKRNRLVTSHYGTDNNGVWDGNAAAYDVQVSQYDDNGNIESLSRNSDGEEIDDLTYTYANNSNQLQSVADASANDDGFDDYYPGTDYSYDPEGSGNMTGDLNKQMTAIDYNHLRLVDRIAFGDGTELRYTYDAAGNRLMKAVYDAGGSEVARVDYIGSVEYLDGEINQVFTAEGRAYRQNDAYHYEYFLTDHQGNNRVAFGVLPERNVYLANMEEENAEFDWTGVIRSTEENHTPLGEESVALNNALNRTLGPAKVLNIQAGDEVSLEVWAKYKAATSNTGSFGDVLSALLTTLGTTATDGGVGEAVSGTINADGSGAYVPVGDANDPEDAPDAYLAYLFFDANYEYQPTRSSYLSVTDASLGGFEKLEAATDLKFDEAGYLLVYVANESQEDLEVYFDDLRIVHESSQAKFRVTQINEYYPFGLPTSNSWRASGYIDPGLLYQSAFAQYDSLTGYYDFLSRSYDPVLGRFFAVDPAGQFSSPYLGMGNVPHMGVDPNGETFWGIGMAIIGGILPSLVKSSVDSWNGNGSFSDNLVSGGFSFGTSFTPGQPAFQNPFAVQSGSAIFGGFESGSSSEFDYEYYDRNSIGADGPIIRPPGVRVTQSGTDSYGFQTSGGNDFIYFEQSHEGTAYKWMLIWQKRYENEIAAYHVRDGSGSKGILVLPWGGNAKEGSNVQRRQAMRGAITDDSGNRLALIHTHPIYGEDDLLSSIIPSPEDVQTTRDIGIPSYIMTDHFYTEINLSIPRIQHEPSGLTEYLLSPVSPWTLFK